MPSCRLVAALVLGTLALLGSFAFPTAFASHHAEAMDCQTHDCTPVSTDCVATCLAGVKAESAAVLAWAPVAAFALFLFVSFIRFVPAMTAGWSPTLVRVPIRLSDIRYTRRRLD